jgi:hypothetical protein
VIGGACVAPKSHCKTHTDKDHCSACDDGYIWHSGKCDTKAKAAGDVNCLEASVVAAPAAGVASATCPA